MKIKFDVYFKKNLGTLCKDNEVDLDGKEAYVNIDLNLVDRLEVNYSIGGINYTDEVTIKDIDNKEILIPFKSDVLKKGLSEFEIIAYMKNGDIKASQTCIYNIEKGIGSGKQAGSGGSSDGHTHSNLNVLNSITQTKVNEWNNKADSTHSHSEYASKSHNHNEYANITHTHSNYASVTHSHGEYANYSHTHNASEIEGLENIDIDLSDYYTKSETYNRTEIDNKIANMGTGGSVDLSNYYTKAETDEVASNKADKVHTHSEYLTQHQDISHKADKEDTYTKTQTDNKISEEIAKAQLGAGDVEINSNNNNLDKVTMIGRWFKANINNEECLVSINMGSELYIRFSNSSSITVNFDKVKGQSLPAYVYSLNNSPYERKIVDVDSPLTINGLHNSKEYTLKIKVEDIPENNKLWNEYAGLIIKSISIDEMGVFSKYNTRRKKALFIGDSITAGISVREGTQPQSGGASINYSAKCCEIMGWDDIRWAFGFTGIVNPGPNAIPNVSGYLNWIAKDKYDFNKDVPDYIFINHGTNDSLNSRDITQFKIGYMNLIDSLKLKFIDTPIICILPFGGYYKDHIKEVAEGLDGVYICDTTEWAIQGLHPNESESERAGTLLAEWINKNIFNKNNNNNNNDDNVYGDIIVSSNSLVVNENSDTTFTVKLSSQPTVEQVVNISKSNSNISLSTNSLIFDTHNYNIEQTVTVTGVYDNSFNDKTSLINLSSNNTSSSISVTIKNIDLEDSGEHDESLLVKFDMSRGVSGDTSINAVNNSSVVAREIDTDGKGDFTGSCYKQTGAGYLVFNAPEYVGTTLTIESVLTRTGNGNVNGICGKTDTFYINFNGENAGIFKNNKSLGWIQGIGVNLNKKSHLVFVFDTDKVCIYLDGELKGSKAGDFSDIVDISGKEFFIGTHDASVYANQEIYETSMYSKAFTSEEVLTRYAELGL